MHSCTVGSALVVVEILAYLLPRASMSSMLALYEFLWCNSLTLAAVNFWENSNLLLKDAANLGMG